jgi:hypothetical protein
MILIHVSSRPNHDVAYRDLNNIPGSTGLRSIVDSQSHERGRGDNLFRRGCTTNPKAPPPIVNLPAGDPMSARYVRNHGVRRQTLRRYPRLFRIRPLLASCRAGYHIKSASVAFL